MGSVGIAKDQKGPRDMIWIVRWAPRVVHTWGASMWHGYLSVERPRLISKRSTTIFMVSVEYVSSTCLHQCGIGAS